MKKFLTSLFITFAMIFVLSIAVFAGELKEIDTFQSNDRDVFNQTAESFYGSMKDADDETFAGYINQYSSNKEIADGFKKVEAIRANGEEFKEYGCYNLYQTDDGMVRTYKIVKYDKNSYMMIIGFDDSLNWNYFDIEPISDGPYIKVGDNAPDDYFLNIKDYKLGEEIKSGSSKIFSMASAETLKKAAQNTVTGLIVVFAVLIFISLIISLFKYLPSGNTVKKKVTKNNEETVKAVSPVKTIEPVSAPVTSNNDLIAVIAAAIAEYEGTSTDSFVVRTIKKRRW